MSKQEQPPEELLRMSISSFVAVDKKRHLIWDSALEIHQFYSAKIAEAKQETAEEMLRQLRTIGWVRATNDLELFRGVEE